MTRNARAGPGRRVAINLAIGLSAAAAIGALAWWSQARLMKACW